MAGKYKFSKVNFFEIPINAVRELKGRDFPLFIYLKKNKHVILRYSSVKDADDEHLEKYKKFGLNCFWVPREYEAEVNDLFEVPPPPVPGSPEEFDGGIDYEEQAENSKHEESFENIIKQDKRDETSENLISKEEQTYQEDEYIAKEERTEAEEELIDLEKGERTEAEEVFIAKQKKEYCEIEIDLAHKKQKSDLEIAVEDGTNVTLSGEENAEVESEDELYDIEAGASNFKNKKKAKAGEEEYEETISDKKDEASGDDDISLLAEQVAEIADDVVEEIFDADVTEGAETVVDIMSSDDLDEEEKNKVLRAVGSRVLGELSDMVAGDKEKSSEALEKCKEFSNIIMKEISKNNKMGTIYDEIIKTHKLDLGRSATVSAFSIMFSMCVGFSSKDIMADIAFGAILHDIGFVKIGLELFDIPEKNYTSMQQVEFETHVPKGIEILDQNEIELSPVVREIIEQHHELFDGSGYPKGLHGFEISDYAQIIAIADKVDDLLTGRFDGIERTLPEVLKEVRYIQTADTVNQYYNPEIFESIVQAVESGRSAATAETLKAKAVNNELARKIQNLDKAI